MKVRALEFDSKYTGTYGEYRCRGCGNTFYDGFDGIALHRQDCLTPGWDNCVYAVGEKTIQEIKEWAQHFGEDEPTPNTSVSLSDLRQHLPQHL